MSVTQPFEYLVASTTRTPEAIAVSTPGTDLTFAELLDTSKRFAHLLREAGVVSGQTVAVTTPSLVQFMLVFAIFHEGAIGSILPLGYRLSEGYQHDWVVTDRPHEDFPRGRQIVLDPPTMARLAEFELTDEPRRYLAGSEICRIAWSSGTTGRPKAIPFSVDSLTEKCTVGRDRWMVARPFLSNLGLGSIMSMIAFYASVISGETFIYPGDNAEGLVSQLQRFHVTALAVSPHQLSGLLTVVRRDRASLPDLGTVLVTGSPLPDFLCRQVQDQLGVSVVVLYASTEAGSAARREGPAHTPGLAGMIEPDVEVRILDDRGNSLPDGEVGVVAIKRDGHPQDYLDAPEATSSSFVDGFFVTGDTGYIRGNELYLEGRVSEIINAAGVKVDPSRIDEVALEYPGVVDAGAFGFGDARGLDSVGLLFVAPRPVNMDDLLTFLRSRLGESAPTHFARVSDIPRSETGKVLRDQAALIFSQRPMIH